MSRSLSPPGPSRRRLAARPRLVALFPFAVRFAVSCASSLLVALAVVLVVRAPFAARVAAAAPPSAWTETRRLDAPEAIQAAAADARHVYAIDSTRIAKYDRETGRRLALSRGDAKHLNSGFFHEGRLFCAHSNYPSVPERSQILTLDPDTMELRVGRDFGDFGGSLTWVVRHEGAWWCNFAHYGERNARTFLARFDDDWRETARWTYPPEVLKKFGAFSASGGAWLDGRLFVTGHDERELYELRVPRDGRVLEFVAAHPAPFTGQGVALDPVGPAGASPLVGIDRARRQLIFARRESASRAP